MGAVKNILAKDFLGNWMTLYTDQFDGDAAQIQKLYYSFDRVRDFEPQICTTPFLTNHLRFEMNTRVQDWQGWSVIILCLKIATFDLFHEPN